MRTTLTLDPDVAAAIHRRRRERGTGLKEEVNELLRAGLARERESVTVSPSYEPRTLACGDAQVADVDDIAEVLAYLDGETFR